ncbi:MAG: hypothetical protein N3G21_10930 [Candidatus Hydrogenedentes bacterium]|nr:hypothetical protein [Candidatus Hydrogenedentota bacterium]
MEIISKLIMMLNLFIPQKIIVSVITIYLLLLLLTSCNPQETISEKGKFEIKEIEQIQLPIQNLIKNGYFNEWLSGSRVPSGFLPPFSKYSYVLKKSRGSSGYDVVQRWNQAGDNYDVNNCFRIVLYDLAPNKKYLLSVSATLVKGPKVEIGIWSSNQTEIKAYKVPLLTISGEENKKSIWETELTIDIEESSNYILAAYAPEDTPQITWHHWVLTEK